MNHENILSEIAEKTKIRAAEDEKKKSLLEIRAEAEDLALSGVKSLTCSKAGLPDFLKALRKSRMSYICEVKKASPSKGIIAEDFPYLQIAEEYEAAGASAISCLTEPYWFKGSDKILQEITDQVNIPVLRKDFTVNEYMIYQARTLGASAVLLIKSILDEAQLKAYRELAESLGMNALVEAHDEEELHSAIKCGAKIIGVNNRNLKDFTVDPHNCLKLRKLAPESAVFVAESGIKTHEDIEMLKENKVDAVLIGETLMRSPDKREMLQSLNGGPIQK